MVAPLETVERRMNFALDGPIESELRSTPCRKKAARAVWLIFFVGIDALAIYYSVTRWEMGKRTPTVITATANGFALLCLFLYYKFHQYDLRNLRR